MPNFLNKKLIFLSRFFIYLFNINLESQKHLSGVKSSSSVEEIRGSHQRSPLEKFYEKYGHKKLEQSKFYFDYMNFLHINALFYFQN